VIVIAADRVPRVSADPIYAGFGVERVIHQITEAQANIVGFGQRLKGGPIAVNISYNQYPHAHLP
jgi:hypothetical protein